MYYTKNLSFLSIYLYVLFIYSPLPASIHETLPTYHWSYDYIEELQARGLCLDLLQMNKPYARGEVAKSLLITKRNLKIGNINTKVRNALQKLLFEFSPEIKELRSNSDINDRFYFRTNVRTNIDRNDDNTTNYRSIYRGGGGLRFGKDVYAFSGVNFDQYDYHDSTYQGYKWRGIVGYTEQAYINTKWKRLQLKIGRDFLKWGPGKSGTLVISNITRPLDHLLASVDFGPFKFTFMASELDEFTPIYIDSTKIPVRRYLSGHRLDLSLWGGRIQAAVSELMLYGGPNETFDLAYFNPVIFYKGAHKNGATESNVLPTIDFMIYPLKNWQVYTSLLIDDIQLEKTCPGDLEPDEIGWLIGFKCADPFQVYGLTINSEYVRIANRTYKTEVPLETFLHRNKPLGHPLGNDFDHWEIRASYWVRNNVWFKFKYLMTRKGEGSLYSPWDSPWMSYTVKQGYEEPFPSGIVEKTNSFGLETSWYCKNWLRFYGNIAYRDINHQNHVTGKKDNYWEGKLRAEIDFMWNWALMSDR